MRYALNSLLLSVSCWFRSPGSVLAVLKFITGSFLRKFLFFVSYLNPILSPSLSTCNVSLFYCRLSACALVPVGPEPNGLLFGVGSSGWQVHQWRAVCWTLVATGSTLRPRMYSLSGRTLERDQENCNVKIKN